MTVAAEPLIAGAESGGAGAASAGAGAAGKKGSALSDLGLNGPTGTLGAASKLFPKPKTEHPYTVGIILIVVGLTGLVGSITGQLPAMIAALFVPDALEDANTASNVSPSFGVLGSVFDVINPANLLNGL